jgi:type IV pilus assembly protein PilB
MSFFKGLIKKDKDKSPESGKGKEKKTTPLEKEAAARPGLPGPSVAANPGKMPVKPRELAAPTRRPKMPSQEQRDLFNAQRVSGRNAKIGRILSESGLVNEDMITQSIQGLSNEAGTTLEKSMVNQGFIREDDLMDALATDLGMERISLNDIEITDELIAQIDKKTAREYKVFPVSTSPTEVGIAIHDPFNIQVIDDLQRILGRTVRTYLASEEEIDRFFKRCYEKDEILEIYSDMTQTLIEKDLDDEAQSIELGEDEEEAKPVVRFVDLMFKRAVHDRASDIHIEPTRFGVTIRFRIDGVCHEMQAPPKKWQNAILSRLKVLSCMDLAEKRVPQDGRIKLILPDRKLDLRVSALPAIYGETIVMRILDQASVQLGLEDVGFLPDNISLFNDLIRRPTGVILMTGPTGSGKTTTLNAALCTINSPEIKIVTIEDPVEYMIDGINQVQINNDVGLNFTIGLRSILRASPDVLLVGEMRDLETAEIGIRAALTGHLVFSTLHTNDAPSAPGRLIDMGIKPFLAASSLQAVVAQRLIRRLCANCKTPNSVNEATLKDMGAREADYDNLDNIQIMEPVGCDRCTAGFRGRTAIHEVMVVDSRIRQLIIRGESGFRIKRFAVRQGMRTLRMDGWEKCKLGQASVHEVARITQGE